MNKIIFVLLFLCIVIGIVYVKEFLSLDVVCEVKSKFIIELSEDKDIFVDKFNIDMYMIFDVNDFEMIVLYCFINWLYIDIKKNVISE